MGHPEAMNKSPSLGVWPMRATHEQDRLSTATDRRPIELLLHVGHNLVASSQQRCPECKNSSNNNVCADIIS